MTTVIDNLVTDRCCQCGISFGLPETVKELRKSDGQWFYCPNGHAQRYTSSPTDKLAEMTKERDQWQAEAARLLEECDRLRAGKSPQPNRWERWTRLRRKA